MPDTTKHADSRGYVVGMGSAILSGIVLFVLGLVIGAGSVTVHHVQLEIFSNRVSRAAEQLETREQIQLLQLQLQRRQGADDERTRNTGRPAVPQGDHLSGGPGLEDRGATGDGAGPEGGSVE